MPPHLIRILWSNFYLNINANFMEMLRNLIENWPFQQIWAKKWNAERRVEAEVEVAEIRNEAEIANEF